MSCLRKFLPRVYIILWNFSSYTPVTTAYVISARNIAHTYHTNRVQTPIFRPRFILTLLISLRQVSIRRHPAFVLHLFDG